MHVHQRMHWGGLGAAPGYCISTGLLRWKARPATSWELDLGGHRRVRQLSLSLSPASRLLGCVAFALCLSLSLCSIVFSEGRIPLLIHGFSPLHSPLLQLVCRFAVEPTIVVILHNPKCPSLSNLVQILERKKSAWSMVS